ncbi:hypothetical protein TNCV_767751 [Trichonephila clavipes]|nr:hypothetical protein TNCV_767751 [Trichonephila clavipes]
MYGVERNQGHLEAQDSLGGVPRWNIVFSPHASSKTDEKEYESVVLKTSGGYPQGQNDRSIDRPYIETTESPMDRGLQVEL